MDELSYAPTGGRWLDEGQRAEIWRQLAEGQLDKDQAGSRLLALQLQAGRRRRAAESSDAGGR